MQDSGGPKNKTQLWADHAKEPDGASRSEGKQCLAFVLHQVGVPYPSYPVTSSKLRRLTK